MILGTHNSGTGEELVWWQRPFSGIFHLLSRCQSRTIREQLDNGVKLFNLQITYYNSKWHFSHGCSIYEMDLLEALKLMKKHAKPEKPIYFQLYLDKNFFVGQNVEKFEELVDILKDYGRNVKMLCAWVEGTNDYIYKSDIKLDVAEHYWTTTWAKDKSWIDKLPLPKRHAKKYNKEYRQNNTHEYLMLDFYEYK